MAKRQSFKGCMVLTAAQAERRGKNGRPYLISGVIGRVKKGTSSIVESTNRSRTNPEYLSDSVYLTQNQKTTIARMFNDGSHSVAYLYDPAATVRTMSAGNDQGGKPKGKGRF